MNPSSTGAQQDLAAPSNSRLSPFVHSLLDSISTRNELENLEQTMSDLHLQDKEVHWNLVKALRSVERWGDLLEKRISVVDPVRVSERLAEAQERVPKAQEEFDIVSRQIEELKPKLVNLEYRLSRYVVDLVLEWKRNQRRRIR